MTHYEEFMMQDDTVFVITFTDMSCEQLYFKGTPETSPVICFGGDLEPA